MVKVFYKKTVDPAPEKDYRKELWIGVAAAVAGAVGCTNKDVPLAWANHALEEFDKRFKEKI